MNENNTLIVGKYFPELNGLRAIAALSVIIAHCTLEIFKDSEQAGNIFWKIFTSGWVGVDLFFVLSGFLITGILIDTHKQKKCLKTFYFRRTLRIFPLYYFALILFICVSTLSGSTDTLHNEQYSLYFLYLGNWDELLGYNRPYSIDHFWSLAVEEQFYLFWPALFLFFLRKNCAVSLCIFIILATTLIRIYLVFNGYVFNAYDITITRLDGLISGALLAVCMHQEGLKKHVTLKNAKYLIFAGLITITILTHLNGSFFGRNHIIVAFGLSGLILLFVPAIILTFTLPPEHIYRKALKTSPLIFMGKISYGMYVYHWFIITLCAPYYKSIFNTINIYTSWVVFVIAIAGITTFCAFASYNLYERHFLKLKDKYAPYH